MCIIICVATTYGETSGKSERTVCGIYRTRKQHTIEGLINKGSFTIIDIYESVQSVR